MAIHGSHFGYVKDNVVCDVDGAGIVTEDGSETGNVIERNFVALVRGGGPSHATKDIGDLGDGFWFRGPLSTVRSNVAANVVKTGFVAFSTDLGTVKQPNFRGAEMADALQSTPVNIRHKSFTEFSDNEVYGATRGAVSLWYIGDRLTPNYGSPTADRNVIRNSTAWHISNSGITPYYISYVEIEGWTQRGDIASIRASSYNSDASAIRFSGSRCVRVVVRDADIQGMQYGIVNRGRGRADHLLIESSYLRNYVNIVVRPWVQDPLNGYRETIIDHVEFAPLTIVAPSSSFPPYNISMEWRPPTPGNITKLESVRVFNYNQREGEHLELFYLEQHPDFMIPSTGNPDTGCPVDGHSNRECAATFGVAIAGRVAPCLDAPCSDALDYPEIRGFVFPLDTSKPLVPDTKAPSLLSAKSINQPTQVVLQFDEPVDLQDAEEATNYVIQPAVDVLHASLQEDTQTVLLTTSELQPSIPYRLVVNGVHDRADPANAIAENSELSFTYVDLGNTLVDFGGSKEETLFGYLAWQSVFTDRYTDFRPIGLGGTVPVVGNNGAYNYQGVGGTPLGILEGDRVVVTWYNDSDEAFSFTPYVSFDDPNRRHSQFTPLGTWYAMSSGSIPAKGTAQTTYQVDENSAGTYSLVNVNGAYDNSFILVCDKIELVRSDSEKAGEDSDGDGIPGSWEVEHELDPHNASDADLDQDQDGRTAREEYMADTDPNDPSSRFDSILVYEDGDLQVRLPFSSSRRRYHVASTSDLAEGVWTVLETNVHGNNGPLSIIDPTPPPVAAHYRALVTLP